MNDARGSPSLLREERAGFWCAKLTGAQLAPAEQAEFDRWRMADPLNRQSFDRALCIWQQLHDVGRSPEVIGLRAAALESLRRANAGKWARQAGGGWRWPVGLAAGVAVLAAAALLVFRLPSYRTNIGEQRMVILTDGSRLSLDAASKVDVDYGQQRRSLELIAGRAKFNVAPDPRRPFVVRAGAKTVTAIGTSFSVELLKDQVQVILYEGRVEVTDSTAAAAVRPSILDAGKKWTADLSTPQARVEAADLTRTSDWETGQLTFIHEPLRVAVQRINRYSAEPIVIADEVAGGIPIDGVFNIGDCAAFLEAVTSAYPLQVRHQSGTTVLSRR